MSVFRRAVWRLTGRDWSDVLISLRWLWLWITGRAVRRVWDDDGAVSYYLKDARDTRDRRYAAIKARRAAGQATYQYGPIRRQMGRAE